jgi:RNA polymerase sigma factor (sigma-70 family)
LNPSDENSVPGSAHGLAAPASPSDIRLAEQIRHKDRKATADLVAGHADAVYAYVAHRLQPNVSQADDLTQDVFLSALRAIDTFRGASSLRQWLLGIARNKVQDYYRQCLREAPLDDAAADEIAVDPDLQERVDTERRRERTLEVLARMRQEYSLLLRWRYWEGRSTDDIAAATARTPKAVERALARARAQFSTLWKEAR